MKYAIKKSYGAQTRIVEVVSIPPVLPAWALNVDAFLYKMYPGYSGWFQLMDDVGNGAVEQPDGSFVNPNVPNTKPPAVLNKRELRKLITTVFGGNGGAAAKLQTYIDAAEADTDTTNAAKIRRLALETLKTENEFTKSDADDLMTGLQFSAQDKNGVLMAWPEST